MAQKFTELQPEHVEFIARQPLFFVGTAGHEGHVNVSPKGMDSLRVVDARTVAWLNLTGSGNETAAHVAENGRMTIMFCSFEQKPLILRLYGTAQVIHPRDAGWQEELARFPADIGARQVFRLALDLVMTSCGYAVPRMDLVGERETLRNWAIKKGRDGIEDYWRANNVTSLDGHDTGIFDH